jgi:hypothetical protein
MAEPIDVQALPGEHASQTQRNRKRSELDMRGLAMAEG